MPNDCYAVLECSKCGAEFDGEMEDGFEVDDLCPECRKKEDEEEDEDSGLEL